MSGSCLGCHPPFLQRFSQPNFSASASYFSAFHITPLSCPSRKKINPVFKNHNTFVDAPPAHKQVNKFSLLGRAEFPSFKIISSFQESALPGYFSVTQNKLPLASCNAKKLIFKVHLFFFFLQKFVNEKEKQWEKAPDTR